MGDVDKDTKMSKKDKRKWFYVVVDVNNNAVDICQTKEEAAGMVDVHPNTVKFKNDTWVRTYVDKTNHQILHYIIAKRFVEPNKNKNHHKS